MSDSIQKIPERRDGDTALDPIDTVGLLSDEYKILQGKVDEIGGFRVTIKGWSVTATIGGLVAIATGKGFSPKISSLAIDVLLGWFWWFERRQVKLSWLFNRRIRRIEVEFDKERRRRGDDSLFSSRNIFRALFGRSKKKEFIWHTFSTQRNEAIRQWVNDQVRLSLGSDIHFYFVLVVASWLPLLLHMAPPQSPSVTPIYIQNQIVDPCPHHLAVEPQFRQNSDTETNKSMKRKVRSK